MYEHLIIEILAHATLYFNPKSEHLALKSPQIGGESRKTCMLTAQFTKLPVCLSLVQNGSHSVGCWNNGIVPGKSKEWLGTVGPALLSITL